MTQTATTRPTSFAFGINTLAATTTKAIDLFQDTLVSYHPGSREAVAVNAETATASKNRNDLITILSLPEVIIKVRSALDNMSIVW